MQTALVLNTRLMLCTDSRVGQPVSLWLVFFDCVFECVGFSYVVLDLV